MRNIRNQEINDYKTVIFLGEEEIFLKGTAKIKGYL